MPSPSRRSRRSSLLYKVGREGGREGEKERGKDDWTGRRIVSSPDHSPSLTLQLAATASAEASKEGGKEEGEVAALRKELVAQQSNAEGLRLRVGEKERAVSELQQDKVELEEKV